MKTGNQELEIKNDGANDCRCTHYVKCYLTWSRSYDITFISEFFNCVNSFDRLILISHFHYKFYINK